MSIPQAVQLVIGKIAETYRELFKEPFALCLFGSVTTPYFDVHSDLDFLIYTHALPDADLCRDMMAKRLGASEIGLPKNIKAAPWGGGMSLVTDGRLVETDIRDIGEANRIIKDCNEGKVVMHPAFWTLSGYFEYVWLSEIFYCVPILDASGIAAGFKAYAATYPEALKQGIVRYFLPRVKFWVNNAHYKSAIARGDAIYAGGIAFNAFLWIVQLLFALNGIYYLGEKKLKEKLSQLPWLPENFMSQIDMLCGGGCDAIGLERQRQILLSCVQELQNHFLRK
jgi:hypothetical protein